MMNRLIELKQWRLNKSDKLSVHYKTENSIL